MLTADGLKAKEKALKAAFDKATKEYQAAVKEGKELPKPVPPTTKTKVCSDKALAQAFAAMLNKPWDEPGKTPPPKKGGG